MSSKFSALDWGGSQYLVIFPLQHVVTQIVWLLSTKQNTSEIICGAIPFLTSKIFIASN